MDKCAVIRGQNNEKIWATFQENVSLNNNKTNKQT
jgi:hypothetical protein